MADTSSRSGQARYTNPDLLTWLNALHASHDDVLQRAFDAPSQNAMPSIQVGASEGKFLTLLMRMIGAKKVVEIGTLAGYSALRLARGLPSDGHVDSFEFDPRHAEVARSNVGSERVTVHVGRAAELLPTIEARAPFDAVFIDADKGSYDVYAEWASRHLRPGGLILIDNAYFFGRLLEDSKDAAAVRRAHELTAQHFDSVCLPTPDGLVVGLKR